MTAAANGDQQPLHETLCSEGGKTPQRRRSSLSTQPDPPLNLAARHRSHRTPREKLDPPIVERRKVVYIDHHHMHHHHHFHPSRDPEWAGEEDSEIPDEAELQALEAQAALSAEAGFSSSERPHVDMAADVPASSSALSRPGSHLGRRWPNPAGRCLSPSIREAPSPTMVVHDLLSAIKNPSMSQGCGFHGDLGMGGTSAGSSVMAPTSLQVPVQDYLALVSQMPLAGRLKFSPYATSCAPPLSARSGRRHQPNLSRWLSTSRGG
mmetsp:Transcript_52547/g.125503  ORF Transcript_52547/g.125503 Transcript_52547/m.125503 type:complete len:265 (-) Transcript_52547:146-940(-)